MVRAMVAFESFWAGAGDPRDRASETVGDPTARSLPIGTLALLESPSLVINREAAICWIRLSTPAARGDITMPVSSLLAVDMDERMALR